VAVDTSDKISLVALGLSSVAFVSQAVGVVVRRAKVRVEVRVATNWIVGKIEEFVPYVTVSAINKRAGIESIDFDLVDAEIVEYTVSPFTSFSVEGGLLGLSGPKFDPLLEGSLGTRVVLEAGAARTWAFRLSMKGQTGMDKPREMRAVVTLTNGKRYKSEVFTAKPAIYPPRPDPMAPADYDDEPPREDD
jgi:hypothetical protein